MTTESTLADGVLYLTLSGDLIGSPDTQLLLASVDEYLGGTVANCAIDLSQVRYINSTGIGVLVSLLTRFRSRGGDLILINPADHPRKLLALNKLNNIFTIAPTQADARQQFTLAAQ